MHIGIDIIEIERIANAVKRPSFIHRVFTEREQAYCKGRGKQQYASMAGIYAAKEAFLKALGTGLRYGSWQDICVIHDEWGAPQLECSGVFGQMVEERNITKIRLSISHCHAYAVANVVMM